MAFAAAIAAFFADPHLAKDAAYLSIGSAETKPVRVIAKQPDTLKSFGDAQIHSETHIFDVQASDVPAPQVGDRLTVNGVTYQVQSEPTADRERLVWTLNVVPL
ncbi:MAG: hypothetical protein AB7S81_00590 [Bdellovibrionales bacterium]